MASNTQHPLEPLRQYQRLDRVDLVAGDSFGILELLRQGRVVLSIVKYVLKKKKKEKTNWLNEN